MTDDDWRDQILNAFVPRVAPLTLVADPDGLLLEERLTEAIRARGFDILDYEEPVAFRFAYESRFRGHAAADDRADLVVRLAGDVASLERLPYDLLAAGKRLRFGLAEVFPTLSYPVVAELDRGDLDILYRAQRQYQPGRLGENATREFVLRHVFEIAPELIKRPSDLLRVLLRRHHRGRSAPASLDRRLIEVLRQQAGPFADWPLEQIVADREAFLLFLRERWPAFLDRMAAEAEQRAGEPRPHDHFQLPGPCDIPFEHDDVRGYVGNLFLDGSLQPVAHPKGAVLAGDWTRIGVRHDPRADRTERFARLLDALSAAVPDADARHADWMQFARRWAELIALSLNPGLSVPSETQLRFRATRGTVDDAFAAWLQRRYAGLHNQPAMPPVMLHQIPRVMARHVSKGGTARAALVIVDGLSLDQWIVVREVLQRQHPELRFRESVVFAWIPTLTSVSRQAAFSGQAPLFFPGSIGSTDREPAAWTRFWCDQGLLPKQVGYAKGLGDGGLRKIRGLAGDRALRVLGLVVDTVDKIMHGMELGAAGMHNQVRQWAEQGFAGELLSLLIGQGYRVYLSSDHGNIEAVGMGSPGEGAAADLRGERVRVYPDEGLRRAVQAAFPQTTAWPAFGLPEDYLALVPKGRAAFVKTGKRSVCHGGIAIEEVLVPFVEIDRGAE
jgi:hypothetical protein